MQDYGIWILTALLFMLKTEDFYEDISNDVEKRFDTSIYGVKGQLPTKKNKKVIGLMKYELGGKIMTESVALKTFLAQWMMVIVIKKLKEQKSV